MSKNPVSHENVSSSINSVNLHPRSRLVKNNQIGFIRRESSEVNLRSNSNLKSLNTENQDYPTLASKRSE